MKQQSKILLLKINLFLIIYSFHYLITIYANSEIKINVSLDTKIVTAQKNFLIGSGFYENKEYKKAADYYEKALNDAPLVDYIKLKYAQSLIHIQKYDDAFNLLVPVSEKNNNISANADIILASILLSKNKDITAISFLNHALTLKPTEKNIYIALSKLYENLDLVTEAINTNIKAVELFPDEINFLIKAANLLFFKKEYKKSLHYYEKAYNVKTNNPVILNGLAQSYKQLNNREQAIIFFEKLLTLNPLNKGIYLELVNLRAKEKDWEKAFLNCEEFISLTPNNIEGISIYASISLKSKQLNRGIKLLEQHSDYFRSNGDYYFWLATLYKEQKQLEEANNAYKKSIEFSENKHVALYYYGKFLHNQQKMDEAIKFLKESINYNPSYAKALNFLGYILIEKKYPTNEAISYIERALKIEPENAAYLDSMGWALFQKNKFEESLFYLKEALKISNEPIILKHLKEAEKMIEQSINVSLEKNEKKTDVKKVPESKKIKK